MAWIETTKANPRRRDDLPWRVCWREGGRRGGARDWEICPDRTTARKFRGLVDAVGNHRPDGYPRCCYGLGVAPQANRPAGPIAATAIGGNTMAGETARAAQPSTDGPTDGPAADGPAAAENKTLGQVYDEYCAQKRRAEGHYLTTCTRQFDQHVRSTIVQLPGGQKIGPLGGIPITG